MTGAGTVDAIGNTMKTFEELDREYDEAHEAWGNHVDTCLLCKRSVFACEEGMRLHEVWNSAWNAARREWLKGQGRGEHEPARPAQPLQE